MLIKMDVFKILVFLNMMYLGSEALKCYACGGSPLHRCKESSASCRPEQNRCMSFLLEGGQLHEKVYYKRCGRVNECTFSKRQGTCNSKQGIHQSSMCRSACCETSHCNNSNRQFMSWVTTVVSLFLVWKIIA